MPRITNSLAEEHAKFNHKNLTDNMDDDYNDNDFCDDGDDDDDDIQFSGPL